MMNIPAGRSVESPGGPPPRTHGTPSGYRNVRVLTPNSLHYRLVAYAGMSLCSLNEFILKTLHLATPIDPTTGLPVPASTLETALGQRPGHGPLDSPGLAPGPGASPSPGALDGSRLDRAVGPVLSGSIPAADPTDPPSAQDHDTSNQGVQAHA